MRNRQHGKRVHWSITIAALLGGAACQDDDPRGAGAPPRASGVTRVEPEGTAANRIAVTVDAGGYHPATVKAPAGRPLRLEFTRTSEDTCGKEVVFPSLDIRRDLPLNQAVAVDLTMPASGSLAFTCGMDMFRGSVVAD